MDQVLICLKKNNGIIKLDLLDTRRKELVALGNAIRIGNLECIPRQVKKALDAGATPDDIHEVAEFIFRDKHLFYSIVALQKALNFEESERQKYISVVNDCKEE